MNRPKYLEGAGISEQKMNLGKFYAIPALAAFAIATLSLAAVFAAPADTNYDESKVPAYELPKFLVDAAGRPVENRKQWLGASGR